MTVNSHNSGKDLAHLNVKTPLTTQHVRPTVDHENATYSISFVPTVSGAYTLDIKVSTSLAYVPSYSHSKVDPVLSAAALVGDNKGKHFCTVDPAAIHIPSCTLFGAGSQRSTAGDIPYTVLQERDQFGNNRSATNGTFTVLLQGIDPYESSHEVYGSLKFQGAGQHLVVYNMTLVGMYKFRISLPGCPGIVGNDEPPCDTTPAQALTVVPAATHAASSLAGGAGLIDSRAADESSFTVSLYDRYGNGRAQGGEGQHLTVHFVRGLRLPWIWNDRMGSGVEFPEARKTIDLMNGSYVIQHKIVPLGNYSLNVVYSPAAVWPVNAWWPSTKLNALLHLSKPRGAFVTGSAFPIYKSPRPAPRLNWVKFDDSLIRTISVAL